jgi:hypothetical protein
MRLDELTRHLKEITNAPYLRVEVCLSTYGDNTTGECVASFSPTLEADTETFKAATPADLIEQVRRFVATGERPADAVGEVWF